MRNRSILLLAVIVLWTGSAADAKYSGGTGEPNDPYQIATAEDLNDIGNHQRDWNKHFILVNDVNLAAYTGTQFNIIGTLSGPFSGVFDGNDHKILNFTWNSTAVRYIGLFGCVDFRGQIKNLGMENVDVNTVNGEYVGSLVGYCGLHIGTIINCYSTGSVSGIYCVGGLVGANGGGGTITNCYSSGSVLGNYSVGGLVGDSLGHAITNCYSTGIVSGYEDVGGLVGRNESEITNCYSTVSISGGYSVGGLVGQNSNVGGPISQITNCYSTGNVSGNECVGGLVGFNGPFGTIIINCYSTGSVSGNERVGGIAGGNGGTITNCYSTGSVTGNNYVGGLVGVRDEYSQTTNSFWDTQTSGEPNSAGGTGKTTAEMKTISTFTDAGWDFVEIWGIGEHQTYPFLRNEPAGDLNYDKKVDFADLAILASHWLEGP
jgi:hypothetical protein